MPLRLIAMLDACVLYPAPLRDLLMWLAAEDLFAPRWSSAIQEEWIDNLLFNRTDLARDKLERTRDFMDAAIPEASVTGYDALISTLTLPDPDDRHVLAAAIHGNANTLVTFNLRDFPVAELAPHGILPMHPDVFATSLYTTAPASVLTAIRLHRATLRRPPKSAAEYIATLRQNNLVQMADWLDERQDEL